MPNASDLPRHDDTAEGPQPSREAKEPREAQEVQEVQQAKEAQEVREARETQQVKEAEEAQDVPVSASGRAAEPLVSGGRPLTPGVAMLATAVAVVSVPVGGLLAAVALTGHVFGAWSSPESLTPGLIGAAMLGTAPGLFAVATRARAWHEARTLVLPLAVVLVGLFTVSLLNAGHLYIARGGSIVPVLFSLGWLFVLGVLCVCALIALAWQHFTPDQPIGPRVAPCPAGRNRRWPCSVRRGSASVRGCWPGPASGPTSCRGASTVRTPRRSGRGRSPWGSASSAPLPRTTSAVPARPWSPCRAPRSP